MFCTKCGKELYDGDRFCAHCGAEVREPKRARYDDVVFNPPFKLEAEKRTEEILRATETPKPEHKSRETVAFDWNLEGFPSAQPRKTEAVDFNWDSVVERRNSSRGITVEKIQPEKESFFRSQDIEPEYKPEPETEPEPEPEPESEPVLSIEELERELFGSENEESTLSKDIEPTIIAPGTGTSARDWQAAAEHEKDAPECSGDERFYTYNQKFDAFQELLDKERERLKDLEESYNREKEVMDYTWAGEVLPEHEAEPEQEPQAQRPLEFVGVAAPAATMTIDLSTENTGSTPSKTKLRYSDVFPRGLVNDDGTGPADTAQEGKEIKPLGGIYDDLDDDEEEPEKRHILAKVIIAILIILIVIEGGILAVKFIAPESKVSLWANDLMLSAIDLIIGKESDEDIDDPMPSSNNEKEVYMSGLVDKASEDMKTIGEAVYSPELKFSMLEDYSFEEISAAEAFVDADWLEDAQGNSVTYGQRLTETLIRYYDGWQDANTDKSLVGINKLEIGEIRTGKEGFYALCRVTYAGEDGSETVRYQTVYLRISQDAMIINEIKEDKL
ncbi:MAG: zinc-ribbon domain-containing protein [Anaerovoracaceae bacterium]